VTRHAHDSQTFCPDVGVDRGAPAARRWVYMPQPDREAPIPPRVVREVEHILDGVAKRLFLERLDRDAFGKRATAGRDDDALDEHAQDRALLGERHVGPIRERRQRRRSERST
jgi:hypothetical protein